MSSIRTKVEAKSWLANRLAQEGPGLWTDRERQELADRVAQEYRPGGPTWRVKEWTRQPEGIPAYAITRGGSFGILTINDREKAGEKAQAIVRALDALDAEMKPVGDPA